MLICEGVEDWGPLNSFPEDLFSYLLRCSLWFMASPPPFIYPYTNRTPWTPPPPYTGKPSCSREGNIRWRKRRSILKVERLPTQTQPILVISSNIMVRYFICAYHLFHNFPPGPLGSPHLDHWNFVLTFWLPLISLKYQPSLPCMDNRLREYSLHGIIIIQLKVNRDIGGCLKLFPPIWK